jgi:hypothetical protein
MHALKYISLALLFCGALASFATHHGQASSVARPNDALASLSWISGDWETPATNHYSEEHWTSPAAGMLLGVSRTVAGEKTVSFEFMRIEARADGVFYVAQPQGRPGVDFKLVRNQGGEAVFENPGHADHLSHIIYRKNADGTMAARIEGQNNGQAFAEDFLYRPMKKP